MFSVGDPGGDTVGTCPSKGPISFIFKCKFVEKSPCQRLVLPASGLQRFSPPVVYRDWYSPPVVYRDWYSPPVVYRDWYSPILVTDVSVVLSFRVVFEYMG